MAHQVTLQWQASADSVDGYNVYRGVAAGQETTKLNSALVSGLTFTDTTVAVTTYFYVVKSSVGGIESVASNEITVTVPSGNTTISIIGIATLVVNLKGQSALQSIISGQSTLTSPLNGNGVIGSTILGQSGVTAALAGTGTHHVSLQWQPSTDTVDGYNLYRGFNSGQENTKINSGLIVGTTFTDNTVTFATYFYTVKSSAGGVESNASNEIEVTVPQGATISALISGQAIVAVSMAGSGSADAQINGQSTVLVSATGTSATITGQSSMVIDLVGTGTFDAELIGQTSLISPLTGSGSVIANINGQSTITIAVLGLTGNVCFIAGTSAIAATPTGLGTVQSPITGQATITSIAKGLGALASAMAGSSSVISTLVSSSLIRAFMVGSAVLGATLIGSGSSQSSILDRSTLIIAALGTGSITSIINGTTLVQTVLIENTLVPPTLQLISSTPVTLSWTTRPNANGYNIYKGPTIGSITIKVNSTLVANTTFIDTNAHVGLEYYAVTYVSSGVESGLSNAIYVASLAPAAGTITYRHNPRDFKVKR